MSYAQLMPIAVEERRLSVSDFWGFDARTNSPSIWVEFDTWVVSLGLNGLGSRESLFLMENPKLYEAYPVIMQEIAESTGNMPHAFLESDVDEPSDKTFVFEATFSGSESDWLRTWDRLSEKVNNQLDLETSKKIAVILTLLPSSRA